jgi:condensation enzyme
MSTVDMPQSSDDQLSRFPLSANLELFCIFDKGDDEGAFGPRHLVIQGWRVAGEIDLDALHGALDDVVERNEILRTEVVRGDEQFQRVLPASPAEVVVTDLPAEDGRSREEQAEEFLNKTDASGLNGTHLPHIRAELGRFDERDAVLVLVTHHMASDGWSMQVLGRELGAFYAERTGAGPASLPEAVQYREFSAWQQESLASEDADRLRTHWRETLRDAELSTIVMDEPEGFTRGYAIKRFVWPAELAAATGRVAKELRASPFMVLTAAFNCLLHRRTGGTDLVASTFTAGRGEPRFADTVGAFFNMVPLRTDMSGNPSFEEIVRRTRATILDAFANDLPFGHIVNESPTLLKPYEAGNLAVPAFQVFQFPASMDGTAVGGLTWTEVRKRALSCSEAADIPNGVMFMVDLLPSGEMAGHVKYNRAEFLESTADALAADYREILTRAIADPTITLGAL